MDHVRTIIDRHFGVTDGELRVGGVSIRDVVGRFGTPIFVYDAAIIDQKWTILHRALPPRFRVYYSVKANPTQALVRRFLDKGSGLEIASGGEFFQAIRAGCPPDKILFAGPGKTDAELEFVLKQGIGELHLESLQEAKRVGELCRCLGVRARVALRINPGSEAQGGAMRMGGKAAPFGVDEEVADCVIDSIVADPYLEFRGLHLFAGTQILDDSILIQQYRRGLDIARAQARRIKTPLHTVDFGGGLGIPYFAHECELNLERLKEGLNALMGEIESDPWLSNAVLLVEPGRFLVGESGVYVSRVTDVKSSRGKTFLILDGGMHHHLAASGNLGQVIKRNFPAAIVNKLDATPMHTVELVGPLCTPLDTLGREVPLPPAEPGDLIGIFQSGAYARTASPLGFLSHPTPAEILVEEGQMRLIRRRGTYEELCDDCV